MSSATCASPRLNGRKRWRSPGTFYVRDNIATYRSMSCCSGPKEKIEASGQPRLEYLCLADEETLEPVHLAHLP